MIDFYCETDTVENPRPCKEQCRLCEHEVVTAMIAEDLPGWMEDKQEAA